MLIGTPVLDSNNIISAETILCLKTLLSITAGTQPLDREFGISSDLISQPLDVFQNLYTLEVVEKIEKYIPGVTVKNVAFTMGEDGQIVPKIRLAVEEETI